MGQGVEPDQVTEEPGGQPAGHAGLQPTQLMRVAGQDQKLYLKPFLIHEKRSLHSDFEQVGQVGPSCFFLQIISRALELH